MLPIMSNFKRNMIAGVAALSVAAAGASPALAWGKDEQQFLKGVLATVAVGMLIQEASRAKAARPVYQAPVQQAPVRYAPAPINIYATPAARAFNSYSDSEQRRIQSTLSAYGDYRGSIDGSFGPGTYGAITLYAQRTGKTAMLGTTSGAFGLLDGLLF